MYTSGTCHASNQQEQTDRMILASPSRNYIMEILAEPFLVYTACIEHVRDSSVKPRTSVHAEFSLCSLRANGSWIASSTAACLDDTPFCIMVVDIGSNQRAHADRANSNT